MNNIYISTDRKYFIAVLIFPKHKLVIMKQTSTNDKNLVDLVKWKVGQKAKHLTNPNNKSCGHARESALSLRKFDHDLNILSCHRKLFT